MMPKNKLSPRIEYYPFLSKYDHNYPANTYRYSLGSSKDIPVANEDYSTHWISYLDKPKTSVLYRIDKDNDIERILIPTQTKEIEYWDFTFDRLMQLAYIFKLAGSDTYEFNYFESVQGKRVAKTLDANTVRCPCLALDDPRYVVAQPDIILAYIRDNNKLVISYQKDRYTTEYNLIESDKLADYELYKIGMTTGLRFGFDLRKKQS